MKTKSILSAFFLVCIFFFATQSAHAAPKGKAKIEIVITSKTTAHQLDSIKTALAAQGVELDIEGYIYTKEGQLKSISGTIRFTGKEAGTFKSDNVGMIMITQKGSTFKIESKDLTVQ